jgi:uncharacterized membrane protein
MYYKTLFLLIVCLFLFSFPVLGAEIHGMVYDFSLKEIKNAVVTIDTVPEQRIVSKEGYLFSVPVGNYTLRAEYKNHGIFLAQEKIIVEEGGSYVFDLFLLPSFEEELEQLEESDFEIGGEVFTEKSKFSWLFGVLMAGVIALVFFVVLKLLKEKRKKISEQTTLDETKEDMEKEENREKEEKSEDAENILQDVLDFINKHDRVNQKDIRKEFPVSEAKISLVLAELEHKGKIEKIKKGRANIIILKKEEREHEKT